MTTHEPGAVLCRDWFGLVAPLPIDTMNAPNQKLWLAAIDGTKIGPFPVDEEWAREFAWYPPGSGVYGIEITNYPYAPNYPWTPIKEPIAFDVDGKKIHEGDKVWAFPARFEATKVDEGIYEEHRDRPLP